MRSIFFKFADVRLIVGALVLSFAVPLVQAHGTGSESFPVTVTVDCDPANPLHSCYDPTLFCGPDFDASWSPTLATGAISDFTGFTPTMGGSVIVDLNFQAGLSACVTVEPDGIVTSSFDIDGVNWSENSTCKETCPASTALGSIAASFDIPDEEVDGIFTGDLEIVWTP